MSNLDISFKLCQKQLTLVPFPSSEATAVVRAEARDGRRAESTARFRKAGTSVTLRLSEPSNAITIRVLDDRRNPIAGARVAVAGLQRSIRSDSDGIARLPGDDETVEHALHVTAPGFALRVLHPEQFPRSASTVDVRLERAPSRSGIVVDASGHPVVAYVDVHEPDFDPSASGYGHATSEEELLARTETDASGRFRFDALPPGPWFVRAWTVESYRDGNDWSGLVTQLDGIEIRLPFENKLPPSGSLISATVVDLEGRRVSRYDAKLLRGDEPFFPRLSGFELRFEDIPPGIYTLVVDARDRGIRRTEIDVRAGQDIRGLEVVLTPPAGLSGRLIRSDGSPCSSAKLALQTLDGHWVTGDRTGADGSFSIRRVDAGEYRMRVLALPGTAPAQLPGEPFTLTGGERIDRDFVVRAAGRIALQLDDPRFAVRPRHDDPRSPRTWSTRLTLVGDGVEIRRGGLTRGTITIDEPLSPGTYELRVDDPRSGSFETRVEVFAGETTEVRVELPPDNR